MSKCVGCGIKLQSDDKNADGYVSSLNHELCERCFLIKNYGQNKKTNKSNIDYMQIFSKIGDNDAVIYVSSLLTLNLDYIDKFKKVILVLTKRDVLPKSIKDGKIINYIKARYNNIQDVIVVSAYKKYNLDILYNKLCECKNNIYFVGITNSGKSTLINEMTKSYNGSVGNITVSNYPSTTLDVVPVKIGNIVINDTPGLLINNSIVNYISDKEIKKLNSKKEIKPVTIQISGNGTIILDDYFRIEYSTSLSSMTFYVSNNLCVESIGSKNMKYSEFDFREYKIVGNQDLVIEDIGFIKFTKEVDIKIYYKYDAYMYLRDKLI